MTTHFNYRLCMPRVLNKCYLIIIFSLIFFSNFFGVPVCAAQLSDDIFLTEKYGTTNNQKDWQVNTDQGKDLDITDIVNAILVLQNAKTKLSPSHWGHPGYGNLAFLYDKAMDALILKAFGYQAAAEDILDYFSIRLRIPMSEIYANVDTNGVYGIIKLFRPEHFPQPPVKALINALDITSTRRQGSGQLEFYTTPGPLSFLIYAFLTVNAEKYKVDALTLGEALLAMQDADGGVRDGDRASERVHTEPHVDACAAMLMLYQITGDTKWFIAAERAYGWFENNVYHPEKGIIDQGKWKGINNNIFATDCYSWTMAGPFGDKIPLSVLKKLTANMLCQGLVKIKFSLPDETMPTVILIDFTNAQDSRTKEVRGGFHPLGSVEWTGGVILALQKNAVRLWNSRDYQTAILYKAIAEILFSETKKCFYTLKELKCRGTFYATGQGVEVGPFGSIEGSIVNGWKTPYFLVSREDGRIILKGASLVGAWPLLPHLGLNPFILNDNYKKTYDQILLAPSDIENAQAKLDFLTSYRNFQETIPHQMPLSTTQIVEPGAFSRQMWKAFEEAYLAKEQNNNKKAKIYFEQAILWAEKITNNSIWIKLAKRDSKLKEEAVGGIIAYPWGNTYPDNNHPLHTAILRYPLLNEAGAAMWGLATANFELGNKIKAKYWIGKIIEDYPLHQIPAIKKATLTREDDLIEGYWNALISWEDNPSGSERDESMGALYREVLKEKGLSSATPKVIVLPDKYNSH